MDGNGQGSKKACAHQLVFFVCRLGGILSLRNLTVLGQLACPGQFLRILYLVRIIFFGDQLIDDPNQQHAGEKGNHRGYRSLFVAQGG
ncbi:hypothetical protein SDC9_187262 [bioreactor metagenome]|uniref:Uncharacterized protein n=1 Tax=bioreactor metagenome TaxID=1076179 RepID=A0A645HWM4_9ZZZZ